MAVQTVEERIRAALGRIRDGSGADVVSSGVVQTIEAEGGNVHIRIALGENDPPALADTLRYVALGVAGVDEVAVDLDTAAPAAPRRAVGSTRRRTLPVVGPDGGPVSAQPGTVPRAKPTPQKVASRRPEEAEPLEGVRHVIAVSSGKGGVGKSTVASNLAAAWAAAGHRVGILDADIYGPDIPTMFGVSDKPRMEDDLVIPLEAHGVKIMSLGLLVDEDTPAIWRGPIVMGIMRQFIRQVNWGELDYLIVDLPPGTGDAQLSLVQLVQVSGAVMVTTPQDVAVGGVLKGIRMFETVDIPVIGVVENMSGFVAPDTGVRYDIFGSGGGQGLAASLELPFLGFVPLGMAVREEGDRGTPTVVGRPDSPEGQALRSVAEGAREQVEALSTKD
ncbi:MAG: Mrp/NBP35 family ATP-binding protein [Gemmatimonadota bacterium]